MSLSTQVLNTESIEQVIKRVTKRELNIRVKNPKKKDFKIENGKLTYIYEAEIENGEKVHNLNKKYENFSWIDRF